MLKSKSWGQQWNRELFMFTTLPLARWSPIWWHIVRDFFHRADLMFFSFWFSMLFFTVFSFPFLSKRNIKIGSHWYKSVVRQWIYGSIQIKPKTKKFTHRWQRDNLMLWFLEMFSIFVWSFLRCVRCDQYWKKNIAFCSYSVRSDDIKTILCFTIPSFQSRTTLWLFDLLFAHAQDTK